MPWLGEVVQGVTGGNKAVCEERSASSSDAVLRGAFDVINARSGPDPEKRRKERKKEQNEE